MKTSEFISLLNTHENKKLLFEYSPGKFAGTNYHITEVKNIAVESVDCGAGTDAWNETIIQLWESPTEKDNKEYLSVYKAMAILNKVHQIKAMDLDSVVKFEYSNDKFHTAQLVVTDYDIAQNKLIIKLAVEKTDCKAGDICGIPESAETTSENSCSPGSGCC